MYYPYEIEGASMNEWIEGPPPDVEGRYTIIDSDGYGYVMRFENGRWIHNVVAWNRHDLNRAVRYCRLPELPKPLPLPRRFRAKREGTPVVGVEVNSYGGAMWVTTPGSLAKSYSPHELTDIEFIDPEEDRP
jgi:hypothetical protein